MAVSVDPSQGMRLEVPELLFEVPSVGGDGRPTAPFDVSPDGRRFVVASLKASGSPVSITVVVNWMTDLKP